MGRVCGLSTVVTPAGASINVSKDIFSRKQYKGDDDDDVYCIGSSQEPPPRPEHKCGGKPVFLVRVLYKKNMKRRI